MTPAALAAPPLARRLACQVYEAVLLFGVVMIAGLAYGALTQQRHALDGQWGLRAVLLAVLATYFTVFWSNGRQTLAMKTWHLQLRTLEGRRVSARRALCRFALAALVLAGALALIDAAGVRGAWPFALTLGATMVVYSALAAAHPKGQALHDLPCGTRLVIEAPGHGQALGDNPGP